MEELRSELLYLRQARATMVQFLHREKIASTGWNSFDNRHQMLIDMARAADVDLGAENE